MSGPASAPSRASALARRLAGGLGLCLAGGLGLCLAGCSGPDTSDTASAFCADQPTVTWDNFGQGFLTESCQTCHASDAPDRRGAPDTVTFDTEADALRLAPAILSRAAGPSPTMPPEGGVSEEDRERLRIWLRCAER